MKVLISAMYLVPGKVGGVQSYLVNLIRGFEKNTSDDITWYLLVREDAVNVFNFVSNNKRFCIIPIKEESIHNRFIWETTKLPGFIKKINPDIVFFPNYFVPPGITKPSVTTVHDLQFIHFPRYFTIMKRLWLAFAYRYCLARSSAVVAISEYTKKDIEINYPFIGPKVKVIYNPVILSEASQEPNINIPKRYILAVAHQYPHKNLDTLLKAARYLTPDVSIVFVGQYDKMTDKLKTLANDSEVVGRIIFTGYISEESLRHLYKNAEAFVLPSLFEGFGMPLVEALLSGIPVITTKLTAIPEITQGYARYVDNPLDSLELANAIAEVLNNRQKWLPNQQAIEQIRSTYDIKNIGEEYINLFKSLI